MFHLTMLVIGRIDILAKKLLSVSLWADKYGLNVHLSTSRWIGFTSLSSDKID